jgi:hypothetical protein
MTFCAEYCLEMPDDFPVVELAGFMAEARRVLIPGGETSAAWNEFAGASNLIGWRYRASADAWLGHKQSMLAHGNVRNHDDVYLQELSLFLMFSAGVACIESTTYALAAAASHPAVCGIAFSPKEQRACSPARLLAWLTPQAKASDVVITLQGLLVAPEWSLWVDLRNRMTHRSNLPRRLFASVGGPPPQAKPLNYGPTSSTPEIDADLKDWDALHQWLASALRDLLVAGATLLRGA